MLKTMKHPTISQNSNLKANFKSVSLSTGINLKWLRIFNNKNNPTKNKNPIKLKFNNPLNKNIENSIGATLAKTKGTNSKEIIKTINNLFIKIILLKIKLFLRMQQVSIVH